MRRFIGALVALLMVLAIAAPVLAADPAVPTTGPVVMVFDGDAALEPGEHAAVLLVVQGDATVRGTADSVTVIGGTATVAGTVRTLAVIDGRAELLPGSSVLGDVLQLNGTIEQATGATIGGSIRPMAENLLGLWVAFGVAAVLFWLGTLLALLVAGMALAAFAARQIRSAEAIISHEPLKALLAGLAMIFIPPLVIVALAITIVGLPLAIALLMLVWPTLAFIGYLVAAIWMGEWLLGRTSRPPAERPYLGAFVGLIAAGLLSIVPLVGAVISIFGLGAVTVAGWRTLRGGTPRAAAFTPQPQPIAG